MATDWRAQGEEHFNQAREANNLNEATSEALLAIYCELRHASDAGGSSVQAMQTLAGVLDEHTDVLHRQQMRDRE